MIQYLKLGKQSYLQKTKPLYNQTVIQKFNQQINIWKLYIKFLIQNQCRKKLQTVLSRAFRLHPNIKDFWIITAFTILENSKDAQKGRAIFQKGLKNQVNDPDFWAEYLRYQIEAANIIYQRQVILYSKAKSSKSQEGYDFIDYQIGQDAEEVVKERSGIEPSFDDTIIMTVIQNALAIIEQKQLYQLLQVIWKVLNDDDDYIGLKDVLRKIQNSYEQILKGNVKNYFYFLLRRVQQEEEDQSDNNSEVERMLDEMRQLFNHVLKDKVIIFEFFKMVNGCRKNGQSLDKIEEIFSQFFALQDAQVEVARLCEQSKLFQDQLFTSIRDSSNKERSLQIFELLMQWQPKSTSFLISYSYLLEIFQLPEKLIQKLQEFLHSNNLMTSRCNQSLAVRIRMLQIISEKYSLQNLVSAFSLIAPLYIPDKIKFSELQEKFSSLLQIGSLNQFNRDQLFKLYQMNKISPPMNLVNLLCSSMGSDEERQKWMKLIEQMKQ